MNLRRDLEHQGDAGHAPDVGLLADFIEAVENGSTPSQASLEEVAALLECRPLTARELRRRRACRMVARERAADPDASAAALAQIVARKLGERPETVRWWARRVVSTSEPSDAPPGEEER